MAIKRLILLYIQKMFERGLQDRYCNQAVIPVIDFSKREICFKDLKNIGEIANWTWDSGILFFRPVDPALLDLSGGGWEFDEENRVHFKTCSFELLTVNKPYYYRVEKMEGKIAYFGNINLPLSVRDYGFYPKERLRSIGVTQGTFSEEGGELLDRLPDDKAVCQHMLFASMGYFKAQAANIEAVLDEVSKEATALLTEEALVKKKDN